MLLVHKDLAVGQITSGPYLSATLATFVGNPLGTAASLRASAINKGAPGPYAVTVWEEGMDRRCQVVTSRTSFDSVVLIIVPGLHPDL